MARESGFRVWFRRRIVQSKIDRSACDRRPVNTVDNRFNRSCYRSVVLIDGRGNWSSVKPGLAPVREGVNNGIQSGSKRFCVVSRSLDDGADSNMG